MTSVPLPFTDGFFGVGFGEEGCPIHSSHLEALAEIYSFMECTIAF